MAKTYKIAVIGGDGTGPEVVREGRQGSQGRRGQVRAFKLDLTDYDFGGDRYLRTGEILPDSARSRSCKKFDAIFLGAIGHPDVKPGILEKGILLQAALRARPVHQPAPGQALPRRRDARSRTRARQDIDYVVVRENTGDVYTGAGGTMMKGTPHEVATQTTVYNRFQVDRCLRTPSSTPRRQESARQGKTTRWPCAARPTC